MAKQEYTEEKYLVNYAFELARSLNIQKIIVQADELRDIQIVKKFRKEELIIWLIRNNSKLSQAIDKKNFVVNIPDFNLTRMSQVRMGVMLSVFNQHIEINESIICLTRITGSKPIDMLIITNPKRDYPWIHKNSLEKARKHILTASFVKILEIALAFASEGREGRAIGTTFVLTDLEEIKPFIRQLILNPCAGHPKRSRNIHNAEFFETLRELAALDGAFIIDTKGVVEFAGVYLDAPIKKIKLRSGLGSRHAAAAAITKIADAISIVISESSGAVTVFQDGKEILLLEQPNYVSHI